MVGTCCAVIAAPKCSIYSVIYQPLTVTSHQGKLL